MNTKTLRAREVAMTSRLIRELIAWRDSRAERPAPAALIFEIADNVKRSFTSARAAAGLDDVRCHDLRQTAATRLAQGHLPLAEVGRLLGHTQPRTTYRYVNADETTLERAVAILEGTADAEVSDVTVN